MILYYILLHNNCCHINNLLFIIIKLGISFSFKIYSFEKKYHIIQVVSQVQGLKSLPQYFGRALLSRIILDLEKIKDKSLKVPELPSKLFKKIRGLFLWGQKKV
jgi:hypothetical protein